MHDATLSSDFSRVGVFSGNFRLIQAGTANLPAELCLVAMQL